MVEAVPPEQATRAAVPLRIAPLVIIGLILLVLSMIAATTLGPA